MKNWKTTVIGSCMVIGAIAGAIIAVIDSDPATVPDIPTLWITITAGAGFIFAKDAGITGIEK